MTELAIEGEGGAEGSYAVSSNFGRALKAWHYLEFMRRRDLVADYKSAYSEPLVKTKLEVLERYAATIYTKEVFLLFREVLLFSSNVRVVSRKKTTSCTLFEVTMYCQQRCWNVAWAKTEEEFTCSCLHIESFGIPCVYIVGVLVYLNITIIPAMLILERWTKRAKQPTLNTVTRVGEIPDAAYMSMHAAMFDDCRDLIRLSCRHFEYYFELKTRIANERAALREKHRLRAGTVDVGERLGVRDPLCARYKRCGRRAVTSRGKSRRVQRCRKCGNAGHNSRKCRSLFVDGSRDASAATSDWQNVDVVQEEDDMLEANVSPMLMNLTYKGNFSVSFSEDAAYSVVTPGQLALSCMSHS
ncbi:hypothetical protein AHAS_Ahas20G0178100 [Arachis hypogaea]